MVKKSIKKALRKTNDFVWYITYTDSVDEKLLTLYATNAKKALKEAERKLRKMYGPWYKIKSISTV